MKIVYKYPLNKGTSIDVPVGGEILIAEIQNNVWCLWIKVDTDVKETESRKFAIVGTGHKIDYPNVEYVNTTFQGSLVWHLFEVK